LLGCLLLLALISGIWIRSSAYEHRFQLLELRANQLAQTYDGNTFPNLRIPGWVPEDDAIRNELVQVVDRSGRVFIFNNNSKVNAAESSLYKLFPKQQQVLAGITTREDIRVDSQTWLRVGVPVYQQGKIPQALYVSLPDSGVLLKVRRLYGTLAVIVGIIALAGWFVLYFLSRKLTLPLREVAEAARVISEGRYDLDLPRQVKEKELMQLIESFRDMAVQLKQLERLRTDLLAGVSHELRTPVTSIRGMIQAVHGKVVTGREAEEFLQISLHETKRLQQMVEELLDFSSFESGAAPIRKEGIDLSALAGEVIQQVSVLPEYSGLEFQRESLGGVIIVEGDSGRLRQALLNLFDNSRKASADRIVITIRKDMNRVHVDVEDNGTGINQTEQPFIFERFYRAGHSKTKGLGLGLTTSRLLASAHGGDLILLRSSPGCTAFRIILPLS
jgi:signal transduction histidine kinase